MAYCCPSTIHQTQLLPLSLCETPFLFNTLKLVYCSSHCLHVLGSRVRSMSSKSSTLASKGGFTQTVNPRTSQENSSGFSSLRGEIVGRKTVENHHGSIVEKKKEKGLTGEKDSRKEVGFGRRRELGSRSSVLKSREGLNSQGVNGQVEDKKRRGSDVELGKERSGKGAKKKKNADSPEVQLRVGLDMCSKRGDVMGAINLFDLAQREVIEMGQYHYTVLLYLCSSAALGVVQPAKSGSGTRVLNALDVSDGGSSVDLLGLGQSREVGNKSGGATGFDFQYSNNVPKLMQNGKSSGVVDQEQLNDRTIERKEKLGSHFDENGKPNLQYPDEQILQEKLNGSDGHVDCEIRVSEDFKKYALQKGFEIYEKMCLDAVPMNEATLTAVARMAMAMGNGDMAFDMVKQMKSLGINPKLRSYGPALSAFCSSGDVDKVFAVEKHMLEHGVSPEEPELVALLRLSAEAGISEKVYYLLHKLRSSVRKVSLATADVIVRWFKSEASSRVGKKRWNRKSIKEAIENRGGGWHGQGWLGKGRWTISCTSVGADALCRCCGEKLAIIDLDPVETENFAESVASIAIKRERDSSFQKFQKWLDYYGPFEAVVDGANVGLFSQQRFMPSKINAIVNGLRSKLPSKRWPLIVLHNKRVNRNKMDQPMNKMLIEKWKNADALYATPTGSNDDWYWLYAAINFKCLIVTNDEMRDHTFQLLGNDFFTRWKERHQVRFSFLDTGPVFHMPPPCSIVIQESEKGHWHIPIAKDDSYEEETVWLCITRTNSEVALKDSTASSTHDSQHSDLNTKQTMSIRQKGDRMKLGEVIEGNQVNVSISTQEAYQNLRNISASVFRDHSTVLSKIEAAEKLGNCVIDFQI